MRRLPLLLCSIGVFAYSGYVSGATITVTTTEPGINADGLCSFAEAVENVSDGDVHSDCVAGSDGLNIIELGQGDTYLQREGDYYVVLEEVMPEEVVIINGNGSTFEAMDAEAGWRGLRFGDVSTLCFFDVIINDLTIKGSRESDGAILALGGRLSLNRCIIKDNSVGVVELFSTILTTDTAFVSNGIGISDLGFGDSTLIAINTDFVSNGTAIGDGRYPSAIESATLVGCTVDGNEDGIIGFSVDIRQSTIINNDRGVVANSGSITGSTVAGNGEGVYLQAEYGLDSPEFILMSSTISGNMECGIHAQLGGFSGLTWVGTAYIRDSTITGNTRGLYGEDDGQYLSQYEVKNSIISSNVENCAGYWSGSSSSRGFNLTDDYSCHFSGHADAVVADVMLSELGDWGGSTQTHIPLEGSPAIDMVRWASQCAPRDQRGYVRSVDGDGDGVAHCDCGAVEYGAEPPPRPFDPRVTASEVE